MLSMHAGSKVYAFADFLSVWSIDKQSEKPFSGV